MKTEIARTYSAAHLGFRGAGSPDGGFEGQVRRAKLG